MIEFKRAEAANIAIHYVGNKGNGEAIELTKQPLKFREEFVKETLLQYFLKPFKSDIYYEFGKSDAIKIHDVHSFVRDMFTDRETFFDNSKKIAQHLYDQSLHPKIKGGELYVIYLRDCVVDGELCDAIGIFKSENKETYLKINQHLNEFEVETENGININKLDKGCLIFNTRSETGYKISIVDNSHRIAEAALYWMEDFLNIRLIEDKFYHTQQLLDTCKGFCEEILTEDNNVNTIDQNMMKDRTLRYFQKRDRFNQKDFEQDVMVQPELIDAFKEYKDQYNADRNLQEVEDFEISPTAVKKNAKYLKSVIKLDKNFHIYIHGRHDYVEKGFDEVKGLHYYKMYFSKEE
jgi:hypothetical protein